MVAGFLVYDYGFIPPYDRLTVERAQNWVALAVYAVVMLLVSRVVRRSRRRPRPRPSAGPARPGGSSSCPSSWSRTARSRICSRPSSARCGPSSTCPESPCWSPTAIGWRSPPPPGKPSHRTSSSGLEPLSGVPVSLGTGPGAPDEIRDRGPDRVRPAGRDAWPCGECRRPRRTGPCCAPSPITPPWPWNGPSSGSRPCARSCSRRSTACATLWSGRSRTICGPRSPP